MRSSDAWLGLPNDLHVFALMQRYVAERLNIATNMTYVTMNSAHLYEKHWSFAQRMLDIY
jgi:thymidylate synthase